jgi:hypothetical protein
MPQHSQDSPHWGLGAGLMTELRLEVVLPGILAVAKGGGQLVLRVVQNGPGILEYFRAYLLACSWGEWR